MLAFDQQENGVLKSLNHLLVCSTEHIIPSNIVSFVLVVGFCLFIFLTNSLVSLLSAGINLPILYPSDNQHADCHRGLQTHGMLPL